MAWALTAARDELGARANGIPWRGYALRRLRVLAPVALVVGLASGLVKLVLGTAVPRGAAVR